MNDHDFFPTACCIKKFTLPGTKLLMSKRTQVYKCIFSSQNFSNICNYSARYTAKDYNRCVPVDTKAANCGGTLDKAVLH